LVELLEVEEQQPLAFGIPLGPGLEVAAAGLVAAACLAPSDVWVLQEAGAWAGGKIQT